jgi:putative thioredoxin
MISLVPPDKRIHPRIQSVLAIAELAEKAEAAGDLGTLVARLNGNPKDYQARFDLAVGLAARGEKGEALELLLELVRLDRKWNEEAGRKQLLQLFEAWGAKEPLVAEGRRRLSSILFS